TASRASSPAAWSSSARTKSCSRSRASTRACGPCRSSRSAATSPPRPEGRVDEPGGERGDGAGGARKLTLLDATLLVMGGIVGVGIFFNPHTIAERVPVPSLYLALWV